MLSQTSDITPPIHAATPSAACASPTFDGQLLTEEVNLRQLLDEEELGGLSAQLTLHGQLKDRQYPHVKAEGFGGVAPFEGITLGLTIAIGAIAFTGSNGV